MKYLLLIILTIFTLTSKAQTSIYHSFPDSNAVWNEIYNIDFFSCNYPLHQNYSYTIIGDTIINSLTFHKIYTPYVLNNGDTSNCAGIHLAGYQGCIRQDIVNRKVYFIKSNENAEILLYDFSLQVGDTIRTEVPWGCSQTMLTVWAIDSILIDANYRKRWIIEQPGGPVNASSFIEGIGYETGLLEAVCGDPFGWIQYLYCFQQNGRTMYPDTTTNCELITGIDNVSSKHFSTRVFPNPFSSSATLELTNYFENVTLNIYNAFGELLHRQKIISQSTVINRSGLPAGIYFYQLSNDSQLLWFGKFMIQ